MFPINYLVEASMIEEKKAPKLEPTGAAIESEKGHLPLLYNTFPFLGLKSSYSWFGSEGQKRKQGFFILRFDTWGSKNYM